MSEVHIVKQLFDSTAALREAVEKVEACTQEIMDNAAKASEEGPGTKQVFRAKLVREALQNLKMEAQEVARQTQVVATKAEAVLADMKS